MNTISFNQKQEPSVTGGAIVELVVRVPDGEEKTLRGRNAWALDALIKAGDASVTPITQSGPRWSSYVHRLRKTGIAVSTIDEKHGGPYQGTHARYTLQTPISVVREVRA